jgi:hypothetical protein
MAAAILSMPILQFTDNDGTPLDGGFLYCYEAGTALGTPQDVFTDSDLAIAYANPVPLDSSGRPEGPIYLLASPAYDFVLTDAVANVIWTATNILAPTVP